MGEQSANMGCGASGEPVTEAKGPTPEEQAAALKVATDKQNKIMEEAVKAILKHSVVASCKTAGAVPARGSAGAYQVGGHFDKSLLPKLKAFAVTEFPPDAKLVETALRGIPIFPLIQQQEAAIRSNPASTGDAICQDVFGNAALMKCKDAYTFVDEYEKGKKK